MQAGRSGKQNIVEGYLEKSLKGYIYLLGIAYASLGELLEDYEDFLRQRGLRQWKGPPLWKKNLLEREVIQRSFFERDWKKEREKCRIVQVGR